MKRITSVEELKKEIDVSLNSKTMGRRFSIVNYIFIVEEIIKRIGYIDQLTLKVLMDLNYEQFEEERQKWNQ